ncbi:MAG: hypothetical protein ABF585_11800, partial [Lacticaseibacillus paracasei]
LDHYQEFVIIVALGLKIEAEKIIKFSEMVLKMNYEYPEIANSGSEAQKLEASKKPSPSSAPSGNPSVNI